MILVADSGSSNNQTVHIVYIRFNYRKKENRLFLFLECGKMENPVSFFYLLHHAANQISSLSGIWNVLPKNRA